MFEVTYRGRAAHSEVGDYAYFVLSTGTFQTYARWRRDSRPNRLRTKEYRDDVDTRDQIGVLRALDRA